MPVCWFSCTIVLIVMFCWFSGQSSSSTGQLAGALAVAIADIGWDIAEKSNIPPNPISPNSTSSGIVKSSYNVLCYDEVQCTTNHCSCCYWLEHCRE